MQLVPEEPQAYAAFTKLQCAMKDVLVTVPEIQKSAVGKQVMQIPLSSCGKKILFIHLTPDRIFLNLYAAASPPCSFGPLFFRYVMDFYLKDSK